MSHNQYEHHQRYSITGHEIWRRRIDLSSSHNNRCATEIDTRTWLCKWNIRALNERFSGNTYIDFPSLI